MNSHPAAAAVRFDSVPLTLAVWLASSPVVGLYVPIGHGVGTDELAGQYVPFGQMLPVTPSSGFGTCAPSVRSARATRG